MSIDACFDARETRDPAEREDESLAALRDLVTGGPSDALRGAIEVALRETTKLRGEVELVPADSLPNDGTVIEDTRARS